VGLILRAAFGVAFVSGVSTAQAGRGGSAIPATKPPSALAQLESATWIERAKTFLPVPENQWATPDMRAALLALYARELRFIVATLVESKGKQGVSDKYGEEYGEYYTRVFGMCLSYCDRASLLDVMLNNARPGSEMRFGMLESLGRFAMRFPVSQRVRIDSTLVHGMADTSASVQVAALTGLGMLLRADQDLGPERRGRIHRALQAATAAKHPDVRESAVGRLAFLADPADLPLLTRLAESDPARSTSRGVTTYPVREAAHRAITKIKGTP